MIEKILIFFIFLGPLVFFHELGHFLFARLFGVRVEVFSIGFGPKLFSFKRGDTQYAFSLIPLGGYVKMFGDDPLSEEKLTPEEEAVAYTKKGKWARFWIVFGGPLANFILAYFIYLSLVSFGEKVPQVKFGNIVEKSVLYEQGFRTGDVLKKINSHEIVSFDDLNLIDSNIKEVTVERVGGEEVLAFEMKGMKFLEVFSSANNPLRAPIVTNIKGENFIITAGTKDIVSLEEVLISNTNELSLYKVEQELSFKFNPEIFKLEGSPAKSFIRSEKEWVEVLRENGLYPRDLMIRNIVMSSPAAAAGLKKGFIVTEIGGNKVFKFEDMKNAIQALKEEKPIDLTYLTPNGEVEAVITPTFREFNGSKYLSIGVESGISFYSHMVESKSKSFGDAIVKAYHRTVEGTIKTFLGFKKLITGEVSIKHVGGPIAIGQVASESFNISLSMFFRLMAIISINLGIINLFPIPVLDGGHIVFIFLEMLNGGPLSRKKLQYAQQFGLSLLFLLIFVALFNDISRLF